MLPFEMGVLYKVLEALFPNPGEIEIEHIEKTGASGITPGLEKVFVVLDKRSGNRFAIKAGKTRVPIERQIKNRKVLAMVGGGMLRHRLPAVRFYTGELPDDLGEAMAIDFFSPWTLHETVVQGRLNEQRALATWKDILQSFSELWWATRKPWRRKKAKSLGEMVRHPIVRVANIQKRFTRHVLSSNIVLGEVLDLPIVIRGETFPSLRLIFKELRRFSRPQFSVVCHNDLNADNLLINQEGEWAIIDWEWVGTADWRMSLSHLIGWWWSNASRQAEPSTAVVKDRTLEFASSLRLMSLGYKLIDEAMESARLFAGRTHEPKKRWEEQLQRYLATLFLGDIRFMSPRGRGEYAADLIVLAVYALYHPERLFTRPERREDTTP